MRAQESGRSRLQHIEVLVLQGYCSELPDSVTALQSRPALFLQALSWL